MKENVNKKNTFKPAFEGYVLLALLIFDKVLNRLLNVMVASLSRLMQCASHSELI
jgi:hypothetical protein